MRYTEKPPIRTVLYKQGMYVIVCSYYCRTLRWLTKEYIENQEYGKALQAITLANEVRYYNTSPTTIGEDSPVWPLLDGKTPHENGEDRYS